MARQQVMSRTLAEVAVEEKSVRRKGKGKEKDKMEVLTMDNERKRKRTDDE
jgi:hypothetical protein